MIARHREGSEVLVWPGTDRTPLLEAGVPAASVEERIGEQGRAAVEAAERTWARLWARVPLRDGKSFRELVTWQGLSLLWLTEAFIRRETAGPRCARTAETALRVLEAARPDEVDALALDAPTAILLARAATARGVLFHGETPRARPLAPGARSFRAGRRGLGALFAPKAPPSPSRAGRDDTLPLLVILGPDADAPFVASFLDAVTERLPSPAIVVRAGELGRWETRRVRRAVGEAEARLREAHDRLRGTAGLHESYTHRGVGFADLASLDLEAILLRRLPDAVHLLETAADLLVATRPGSIVIAGFGRDDRRALVAAAGAGGVPSVALRLAPPDPDDLDRADGGPQPTLTLEGGGGADPALAVARLGAVAHARLDPV